VKTSDGTTYAGNVAFNTRNRSQVIGAGESINVLTPLFSGLYVLVRCFRSDIDVVFKLNVFKKTQLPL
jgi:hypothetical protein